MSYQKLNQGDCLLSCDICLEPKDLLLKLVLDNDTENIGRLIENYPDLLTHIYTPEYNKPILLIACAEKQVKAETVKELINCKADLHCFSEIDDGWEAIHFAACRTDSSVLKAIVTSFKHPLEINATTAKGNNALHVLITYGKSEEIKEFEECARILVTGGIDVNFGDHRDMSPVLCAAKKKFKGVIKIILNEKWDEVDLDSHMDRDNKTARDLIVEGELYDGDLPEKVMNKNENDEKLLFKYAKGGNDTAFVTFKNGEINKFVNANDDSSGTLLQLCCKKMMNNSVKLLLDKGADPNLTTLKNNKRPIEIAAEFGYYNIFEAILNNDKTEHIPTTTLITLLKYYDYDKFVGIDHQKCCDLLLIKLETNRKLVDINGVDLLKKSPLHYAVNYTNEKVVEKILDLGASLGARDRNGVMPIENIEPEVLKNHLDKCIKFDEKSKKFEKENFIVTFDYLTLIPPVTSTKITYNVNNNDVEAFINSNDKTKPKLITETDVIYHMSKSPEFKDLLQHPVIVSFLFMKWCRISALFWANLIFYIAFFVSLLAYIFAYYANFEREKKSRSESGVATFFKIIFAITYFMLLFRELFQMLVSPKKYFKAFENYVELLLIIVAGMILFLKLSPNDDLRRQLSSICILLAAFELVLLFGQHPKLSTNVVMLKTVSYNFFKFLVWYSLLIIGFACSFYVLFSEDSKENGAEGENNFFSNISTTFFKTIVMTTGEFDAGNIKFDLFPVTSQIIFSLFIFMIVIILLNLLNGLAVSDTQWIKSNAELVGHIARAEHIHYIESMILGNILPVNFINKLSEKCCCCPTSLELKYSLLKPLAEKVCLFPNYLTNYELNVCPNKSGKLKLPSDLKCHGYGCNNYLDKTTLRRTCKIMQDRKESLRKEQEKSQINVLEESLRNLRKNYDSEKVQIMMLNNKFDELLKYLDAKNKNL